MKTSRKILWAVGVILAVVLLVAVSMPDLLRSHKEAYAPSRVDELQVSSQGDAGLGGESAPAPPPAAAPAFEKKLVRNAGLGLIVADVRAAAEQIQKMAESHHGEIDKLEIAESSGGLPSATLVVRVPSSGLESAIAEFKKVAVRTEHEEINATDVTQEFYDNEAHMRNLHAEEQQYLAIMKQARTVKDTLEVSEKLSDVRDRIERLQAQINVMTHDIDMSVVTITLAQEVSAQVSGLHWHPLYNAKIAVHEMLAGLADWSDWALAIVIKLPLILLWVVTAGAIAWVSWMLIRFVWLRFLKPSAPTK